MRPRLAPTLAVLALAAMLVPDPARATQEDDIGDTFARFLAAQNAHDLDAVGELLSDSPDFIWASPGDVVRGRDAALGRFRELLRGTWRVEPHWLTFQILKLDVSTAEIFVRVLVTSSTPAQRVRLNLVLVDTAHGWRVLSILASEWPPD